MGTVWLAHHTSLDVPCAVKFIHEQAAQSPQLRARFEHEARSAASLRTPHVVQILDHGVWQDAPYIAMEYLEGEDLDQALRRRIQLSPAEALDIAVQVGRALSKAHTAGLVHRDLKPGNIFLVRDEGRIFVKVLDFGIAKISKVNPEWSIKTGELIGTPLYMSPEQTRGVKTVDHRSDLWTLAVVVFQCLTGRVPFDAEALVALFMQITEDPVPIPSNIASVPLGFDAWWARATMRDPAERFQTAGEFCDALEAALTTGGAPGVAMGTTIVTGGSAYAAPFTLPLLAAPAPQNEAAAITTPGVGAPGQAADASRAESGVVEGNEDDTLQAPLGVSDTLKADAPAFRLESEETPGQDRPLRARGSRQRKAAILVVILGFAGALVVTLALVRPHANVSPGATSSVDVSTAPSSPVSTPQPAPSISATEAVSGGDVPAKSPPSTPANSNAHGVATGRSTVSVQRGAAPPAPVKRRTNCDVPFYLDASGEKHFKPECL